MKFFLALSAVIAMIVVVWLLLPRNDRRKTDKAIALFKTEVAAYIKSAAALKTALSSINKDSAFVLAARESLIQCRLQYKHLSFFLEYYFPEQALVCNGPPVPEIENGLDEYRDPVGMQVVESYLFAEDPLKYRKDLLEQADMLQRSLSNILPFLENFKVTEKDIISACSLELTRIYTLYITGYDAPQLKSGIAEAAESLRSVKDVLGFFFR